MKMTTTAALAAGLAFTMGTQSALANGIDWRQRHQGRLIYNGIKNNKLTFQEAGKLIKGQARVRYKEHKFRQSGGGLGPLERLKLHGMINKQRLRIFINKQ